MITFENGAADSALLRICHGTAFVDSISPNPEEYEIVSVSVGCAVTRQGGVHWRMDSTGSTAALDNFLRRSDDCGSHVRL